MKAAGGRAVSPDYPNAGGVLTRTVRYWLAGERVIREVIARRIRDRRAG